MKIIRSMAKPRSQYVKNKLNGLEWSERTEDYIKNLLTIEDRIVDGVNCYSSAICNHFLKGTYPEEYAEIVNELRPERYNSFIEERRKREEDDIRLQVEVEMDRRKDRERWKAYGGS